MSSSNMDSSHPKQHSMDDSTPASDLTLASTTPYKHPSSKLYRAFLDDPTLSNLTIRLSNRRVYAHRIVLCRGSEYFANMLTGRFQESASKEIELHDDDPDAMLALLRFLYGLPYDAAANTEWSASLHPHALVYIVADKYQLGPLQEAIANNMRKIISTTAYTHHMGYLRYCDSFKNSDDFFSALRTILEITTTHDAHARKVLTDFLIQNIDYFRKQDELLSLFKEYPELAVEIISHQDLETEAEGFWMCFADDCGVNVPSCSKCKVPFETCFMRRHRYDEQWECPGCKFVEEPTCLECQCKISWVPDSACDSIEQESGNGDENGMDLGVASVMAAKANRRHAGR